MAAEPERFPTRIRPYRKTDRPRLLELAEEYRAMDPEFHFADPDKPENFVTFVAENEAGEIIGAVTGQAAVEAFMVIDRSYGTPQDRWALVESLIDFGGVDAYMRGFPIVYIGVCDYIKGFARRLLTMTGMTDDNNRAHLRFKVRQRYADIKRSEA